jgi:tetratricopeptide (TPR) repeat protein
MFRNRNYNRKVPDNGSFPEQLRDKIGYEAGERYLPYRMQDRYSRTRTDMTLETIVLENERLEAVFLPEYGGRLYSLIDKQSNRNLLYTNPVFQPGNLAILNAWFSGGIEWNIGQLGHTFTTSSPMHAAKLTDADGNEFLRMYEYERCKNVFWHIDFHLPAGSDKLLVYVRMVNDNDCSVPMYWWTNIAVEETPKARVFSTTDEVIYIDHEIKGFGLGNLPILPTVPDADVTYPLNFPFSNEYFFQTPETYKAPWEAVSYEDGKLFYERSTSMLRYRKMFCWGHHPGGRRWCDFLANPGEGNYIEIQSGLAPTQLHGLDMPAHTEWDFTQVFGLADIDVEQTEQQDWQQANDYVHACVDARIGEAEVYELHRKLQAEARRAPGPKLYEGSVWGSLELQRRERNDDRRALEGFDFSTKNEAPDTEHLDWVMLLNEGRMPERDVNEAPRSWMVQDEWLDLLTASLQDEANGNWNAYMHLGVMLYERSREDEANEAWRKSIQHKPSAWVYRNLAVVMKQKGKLDEAADLMEKAWKVSQSFPDRALAEEYLNLLVEGGQYETAWRLYQSLPAEFAGSDRIQIIVGAAALELNEEAFIQPSFAKGNCSSSSSGLSIMRRNWLNSATSR